MQTAKRFVSWSVVAAMSSWAGSEDAGAQDDEVQWDPGALIEGEGQVDLPPPDQRYVAWKASLSQLDVAESFWDQEVKETSPVQILNRYTTGRFLARPAGVTLDLLALRHDLDIERILQRNGWEIEEDALETTVLCLSHTHRVLPDESLTFLATLYETDVDTLRDMNDLGEDEPLQAWSALQVPHHLDHRDGVPSVIRRMEPAIPLDLDLGVLDHMSTRARRHRVVDGETVASIAKRYELEESTLRRAANLSPQDEPDTGTSLIVGGEVDVGEAATPELIALVLERQLWIDLDETLGLNGVERPEDLAALTRLKLPPSPCWFDTDGEFGLALKTQSRSTAMMGGARWLDE